MIASIFSPCPAAGRTPSALPRRRGRAGSPVRPLVSIWAAVLVLLALVTTAFTPSAHAAEDPRELEGRSLFARGEYGKALEVFSTLFAEKGDPVYLRNIGRCHQMLRSPDRAIDAFRAYLRRGRNLRPAEREEIQGYIREMEALAQEQTRAKAAQEQEQAQAREQSESQARARMATKASEASGVRSLPAAAVPPPAPPTMNLGAARAVSTEPAESPSLLGRWWFWAGVGGALAAGTAAAFYLAGRSSPGRPPCPTDPPAICPM